MRRAVLVLGLFTFSTALADEPKSVETKVKEIAGVAEFLKSVPKHFATLQSVDPARRRVTLLVEGDKLAKTWPLMPDAEVKFAGWWGRLDQFKPGDRVWAWFQTDRQRQPIAVMMLADEMSEQDIHDMDWRLIELHDSDVIVRSSKGIDKKIGRAHV